MAHLRARAIARQHAVWSNYLVVRTHGERQGLTNELRSVLKSLDPAVPLFEVRTM